jgi:small-conductance mechanosensitive channel
MGVNVSLLLGASAALLVGIGFGLQDIFKDFISGILILFEGNFKVGDIIEYKTTLARVTSINLRTSRVITRDGNRILIPNSILVSNEIINWSIFNPSSRFMVEVGVAYGSDVELVKKLLLKCASDHSAVSQQKESVVFFDDFGNSSLVFKLMFWCNDTWDEIPIKSDIRFAIEKSFNDNNIRIPFPQRDLHVIDMPVVNKPQPVGKPQLDSNPKPVINPQPDNKPQIDTKKD